jgi:hypothetical protein
VGGGKRKRGRPKGSSNSTDAPKRQRTSSSGKKAAAAEAAKTGVTVDESIELRDLVGTLTEEQQQRIVQIMMEVCFAANALGRVCP